ncbi:Transcription initiation factor TFIID subunit 12 [Tetrabaena socialis]|uniref:Transcription initiation factor TFIID subunit 12 n=1 Tax=Tetrabaena socialis TaxID=47790 RepID=A0A2J8AJL9_9CHLO|nr:Transcription initiation factor TFIID subunit 12 [Tetrabaena socialis]|eukprot:PNH12722.1 Transcription initiation factor TFIID subunit 12 [Tetrabaena socialis]
MSQPGNGGGMAPGPARSALAPGPQPGMHPGPAQPSLMAPGQHQPLSMAPTALPIQPLHMGPGMAPQQGQHNTGPRAMAPGAALQQPNPYGPPQHLHPQQPHAQAGQKRPADAGAAPDTTTSPAAKRHRPGEAEDAGAGMLRPGAAPMALPLGGPQAAPQPQLQQPGQVPLAANVLPLAMALHQAAAVHQAQQAAHAQALAEQNRRRVQAAMNVADEGKLLPRRGIAMALKAAGMEADFVLDPATETALLDFYVEWIGNAVALGCEAAKRRKSSVLKARDVALHLERSWNLYVPGFNADTMRPYRRANASELHRQRQLAVRRTAAELDHQQAAHAGGGGGQQAGGGAGGSGAADGL